MAATARALSALHPFVAAPLALAVYAACLKLTGGLEAQQIEALRGLVASKIGRLRRA